ncbi:hypothetical protein DES32_1918 [Methylovirgula ligni]|uniref:Uncharacterized protein n=1 Tax=Methylovirgula ligni TaxID=569860 RepID=A0A3D9YTD7_9HYPH|nr:hypothetical protein DES32_1918 [Methylovirgula ligni]
MAIIKFKKILSHTRASSRKVTSKKTGLTKRVSVKAHTNRINRKPRKK